MVETLKPTRALAGIIGQYRTNTDLVVKALSEVKEKDISRRPEGPASPMSWIVGHITDTRFYIGELAGLETKSPWGKLYEMGSEVKEPGAYPPLSEILTAWKDLGEKLANRFEELAESDLAKPVEPDFPGQEKTVFGAIAFLSLHESYHVGQLAYIMRLFGYDRLVG